MDLNPAPPSSSSFTNFPILAVALLAIMVTALLLVSYYIFVIKCCLNFPHLHRTRGPHVNESSWLAFPSPDHPNRHQGGVDDLVLRDIPTFKYKTTNNKPRSGGTSTSSSVGETSFRGCAVCLSSYEDQDTVRVLPQCGHLFHLDCIDIWLVSNANCPLCRSSISGSGAAPSDHILAPSSSPQRSSDDFMVIEIGGDHHSVERQDSVFDSRQAIRRSFSMDSAMDQRLLLEVQRIVRRNRRVVNEGAGSSNGRSSRRSSFFSFGHGQGGSKNAILPIQSDDDGL